MKRNKIETLEFKNLNFFYDQSNPIFKDVNYIFPETDVTFIQGPTGGGKTTLMKLLLGLVGPTTGEYLINGKPVQNLSYTEFDEYRLNMGFSSDVGGLINNQSIFENFKLPLDFHDYVSPNDLQDYIIEFLQLFNLQDQKNLRPAFVSSGTRKAASVLKAFILNPQVLILNNPTLGLNQEHIKPLVNLIELHRKQKGLKHVFIASDDVSFMQYFNYKSIQVLNNNIVEEKNIKTKIAS